VLARLERDLRRLTPPTGEALAFAAKLPVVVSLSSDPYPDAPQAREAELGITRACLKLLAEAGFAALVQTKSPLVTRDLDLLHPRRSLVGLTVTTDDDSLAARMEPYAAEPSARIEALRQAAARGFATICRIDPIVPRVNDDPAALERLVARLAQAGVKQIVSSTFKMRWDSEKRFAELFPEATTEGYQTVRQQGYRYLVEPIRRKYLEMVRDIVHRHGMAFSCCRESMQELNDATCDGQGLLRTE
jgi:DNA repair photolyase